MGYVHWRGNRRLVAGLGIVAANMNPLAALFIILGVLLIIVGIKGSYKSLGKSFKAL
jgi:hypothetical protein